MTTTTDRESIQGWAKKHNAVPGVREQTSTANDQRPLVFIYPEDRDDPELREISWGTFFEHLELRRLAVKADMSGMGKTYELVSQG